MRNRLKQRDLYNAGEVNKLPGVDCLNFMVIPPLPMYLQPFLAVLLTTQLFTSPGPNVLEVDFEQ